MNRACLNMLASSNGGRKRKAPEGREMAHSPPPPGFPVPRYRRAGAGAGAEAPSSPPLNLELSLGQPGAPPLNPQSHLHQPGASSSTAALRTQALKYNNDVVVNEMLEEMYKRQDTAERLKKVMEATVANYRAQVLTMADRVKALEKTIASLNVALHQQATHPRATPPPPPGEGGGDGAAQGQVVVIKISCKICWREAATMMVLPCRHLCMCKHCARTTNRCPICRATFQGDCIEVRFY